MTDAEKFAHCRGCGNDFYNDQNPMGIKRCWSLKDATLVTRYAIGFWTPMNTARNLREVRVFNCYHERGSSRTVYMTAVPDHLRDEWQQLQQEARLRARKPAEEARPTAADPR